MNQQPKSPGAQAYIDALPLFASPRDVKFTSTPDDAARAHRRQLNATSDIAARAALNGSRKMKAPRQKLTLEEAAEAFIKANPHVWQMFCRFSWEAYNAGRRKIGIALIFERMRWEQMIRTDDPDGFKLNNNHKAHFARRFMREFPEVGHLFTTRVTEKEKTEAPRTA